jgi:hypothetical protein
VLVIVGLYLVLALESSGARRSTVVSVFCGVLFGLYIFGLLIPESRSFFELAVPNPSGIVTAVIGAAIAIAGLEVTGLTQARPARR